MATKSSRTRRGGAGAPRSKMLEAAKAAVASQPVAAIPSFLQRICEFLETAPESIVEWRKHGLSFVVHNTQRFSTEVLGVHFKSSNFSSFVRQLNFYGEWLARPVRRVARGVETRGRLGGLARRWASLLSVRHVAAGLGAAVWRLCTPHRAQ